MADRNSELREPLVSRKEDLVAQDGRRVTTLGRYCSIAAPRKGPPLAGAPKDRAVIVLDDGTEVFLEPIDSQKALRSAEERHQFEAKRVRVTGTAHRIMPSQGQSLIAPCIAEVMLIVEDE
jgi:hypothetical protein